MKQPIFIPSVVKATPRKSHLGPDDPTCTVWMSVGQVSKRSSACRLAIRRREAANMVVLPKGATLQIDAWLMKLMKLMELMLLFLCVCVVS